MYSLFAIGFKILEFGIMRFEVRLLGFGWSLGFGSWSLGFGLKSIANKLQPLYVSVIRIYGKPFHG